MMGVLVNVGVQAYERQPQRKTSGTIQPVGKPVRSTAAASVISFMSLVCILLVAGCASSPSRTNYNEKNKDTISAQRFETFLDEYMLKEMSDISKIISYYKSQADEMTQEERDQCFVFIYRYFEKLVDAYNDVAFDSGVIQQKFWDSKEVWGKYGVSTISNEGYCFGMVSCIYLESRFKDYVSKDILDFLVIRGKEQQQVFQWDGAIEISRKDLAQRCIVWEDYRKMHPESLLGMDAHELHRIYVSALLSGTVHTHVYLPSSYDEEWKNSPQVEEIRSVYRWLMSEYPQNELSQLLKEYLPLLEKVGWSDDPSVEAFLEEHGIEPYYASRRMIQ